MSTASAKIAALEEWIREKEGETLEFKRATNRFDFEELAKYCSALATKAVAESCWA